MINRLLRIVGMTAVMLSLVSCGSSKPSHYYLLSDLSPTHVKVNHGTHKVIGVGPVVMAKYLNQPQIVTRNSINKVNIDEFNRWAEPLDDNFTRVVSKNLQKILQSDYIAAYPWQHSESVDYQVKVDVYRFDATTDGKVICDLRYEIMNASTKERLLSKSKTYHEFIGQKYSYTQLAHCMSRVVARFSRDLAQDLRHTTRKLPYPG